MIELSKLSYVVLLIFKYYYILGTLKFSPLFKLYEFKMNE